MRRAGRLVRALAAGLAAFVAGARDLGRLDHATLCVRAAGRCHGQLHTPRRAARALRRPSRPAAAQVGGGRARDVSGGDCRAAGGLPGRAGDLTCTFVYASCACQLSMPLLVVSESPARSARDEPYDDTMFCAVEPSSV